MTIFEAILWHGLALVGLIAAGVAAGLETGVYSLNRVRLHVLEHRGRTSARLLARQMAVPAALIGSLLIGHNAGVKLATHAAAVLLHAQDLKDWQVVVFDALIMMPLLFIFAETVPKDLFAVHADRLLYLFARPVALLVVVCRYTGVLTMMTGTARLCLWALGGRAEAESFHPRHQVQTLVREGVGHGLLSEDQMAIVQRVLDLADRRVSPVMTPWQKVRTVKINDPPAALWKLAETTTWTRFPVVDDHGNVLGQINVVDALVHDVTDCPPIESIMTEPLRVTRQMPLREVLALLQRRRRAMALVVDESDRPVGIVSIKDLVEPITGQLAEW